MSTSPTPPFSPKPGSQLGRFLIIGGIGVVLLLAVFFAAPHLIRDQPATPPAAEALPDVAGVKAKAERGDAEAQKTLGAIFAKGQGVKQDYKEAAKWYRLAAEQGNAAAQTAMGELCESGQGTSHDDVEAAKWYRRAAEQGYAPAQYNLAALHVIGKGVNLDEAEALKWYRKAAEQGDELAQYNLGMRFLEGKGVKPDVVEAFQWLSLAKDRGVTDGAAALDLLKPRMTREQVAEGKRRTAAFVIQKPGSSTK